MWFFSCYLSLLSFPAIFFVCNLDMSLIVFVCLLFWLPVCLSVYVSLYCSLYYRQFSFPHATSILFPSRNLDSLFLTQPRFSFPHATFLAHCCLFISFSRVTCTHTSRQIIPHRRLPNFRTNIRGKIIRRKENRWTNNIFRLNGCIIFIFLNIVYLFDSLFVNL